MKGIRGVFAAVLVLESIVVLLALLVFARFGNGPPAVGVAVIVGLAVLMIVGSGLQRRPWGLSATRWCCSSSRSWPGSCWSPRSAWSG